MLQARKLSLEIGGKRLLDGVSFTINRGQKVGLVGRNGQGKTTLLKVLCKKAECPGGQIHMSRGFRLCYLPQEVAVPDTGERTVFQEAEEAFSWLFEKRRQLEHLAEKLKELDANAPDHSRVLEEHDTIFEELNRQGYYNIKGRIEAVLGGLGFRKDAFHIPVSSLSGGWVMRVELAKILLSNPDLILLDEPTNHLDLPSLTWLEDFLKKAEAGCIIVSHDRAFLDSVTDEIWELEQGRLHVYKGNYSFYQKEKKRRLKQQEAAWKNQQKRLHEINGFIQRFRAKATKAKQVQSRIRQLEKMELVDAPCQQQEYHFHLPEPKRAGKIVLEAKGLSKAFGKDRLFSDLSFLVKRGSKMAVVGPNGAGKSTLLKILGGRMAPDSGQVILGHNVEVAFFAQHQALEFDVEKTVLDTLRLRCQDLSETRLRTILGTFMFSEEDVQKRVSVLSGGEKSRLALAVIMARGANLLLLDEPTNHLDMEAQEAVRVALSRFEGSVVVVSHNRYFLDGFVDSVLEISEGKTSIFPGNVSSFLEHKESMEKDEQVDKGPMNTPRHSAADSRDSGSRLSRREKKRLVAELRQEKSRKLLPFKEKAMEIESAITALEDEKTAIEEQLSDVTTYNDQERAARLNKRYRRVKHELEGLYSSWERACQVVEEMQAEFDKRIMEAEAR